MNKGNDIRAKGKYTFPGFSEPCATGARETVNALFPRIGCGVHPKNSVGVAVQVSASWTRVGDGSVCAGRAACTLWRIGPRHPWRGSLRRMRYGGVVSRPMDGMAMTT